MYSCTPHIRAYLYVRSCASMCLFVCFACFVCSCLDAGAVVMKILIFNTVNSISEEVYSQINPPET